MWLIILTFKINQATCLCSIARGNNWIWKERSIPSVKCFQLTLNVIRADLLFSPTFLSRLLKGNYGALYRCLLYSFNALLTKDICDIARTLICPNIYWQQSDKECIRMICYLSLRNSLRTQRKKHLNLISGQNYAHVSLTYCKIQRSPSCEMLQWVWV